MLGPEGQPPVSHHDNGDKGAKAVMDLVVAIKARICDDGWLPGTLLSRQRQHHVGGHELEDESAEESLQPP